MFGEGLHRQEYTFNYDITTNDLDLEIKSYQVGSTAELSALGEAKLTVEPRAVSVETAASQSKPR
jgi:hypothetical protein